MDQKLNFITLAKKEKYYAFMFLSFIKELKNINKSVVFGAQNFVSSINSSTKYGKTIEL